MTTTAGLLEKAKNFFDREQYEEAAAAYKVALGDARTVTNGLLAVTGFAKSMKALGRANEESVRVHVSFWLSGKKSQRLEEHRELYDELEALGVKPFG